MWPSWMTLVANWFCMLLFAHSVFGVTRPPSTLSATALLPVLYADDRYRTLSTHNGVAQLQLYGLPQACRNSSVPLTGSTARMACAVVTMPMRRPPYSMRKGVP